MLIALQVEFIQPEYNVTENEINVTITLQANESALEDFDVSLMFQSITAGEYSIIIYPHEIHNLVATKELKLQAWL